MDEKEKKRLEAAGIDVEDALLRFMSDEGLMMKFLLRFPEDKNFQKLKQAMEEQDTAQAYTAAHTLKGVAGNLAMTALFRQVSAITEDLRAENLTAARSKMEELEAQYCQVVSALTAKE